MIIGPNDGWTGVFFKVKDKVYLIDSSKQGKIHYRRPDSLFLTHSHLDHCYFAGLKGEYNVYCSKFSKDFLTSDVVRRRLHSVPQSDRFIEVRPCKTVELDGLSFEPILVEHSCPEAYAWLVESDDHRVLVTGDWYDPPDDYRVIDALASTDPDVLITESTRAPSYTPDTPKANMGRLEWVSCMDYDNVVLLANWQHVELVRQFSKIFGTPFIWYDDPLALACDIEGVKYFTLNQGDDPEFPLVTSLDARIPTSTECIVFEFSHHPKARPTIDRIKVSLGGHACRTEIKRLISEADPNLVILHHGADKAMKAFARWVERVLRIDTAYWPKTGEPSVLSIKLE